MKLAQRMQRLGTETAFEVLQRAKALERQGRSIVPHLEIGEPDFDTPGFVVDAAVQALEDGHTHYCPSPGIPELQAVVARHVSATRNVDVGADQVVVTPGAKPIIFFAGLALLEPGDEVIYPDPGFPIYHSVVEFCGATPKPIELREEDDFDLDLDRLEDRETPKTKMIIDNSPQNPTGGVVGTDRLERLAALLRDRPDVWVFSDEIYSRMVYGEEHSSLISLDGMAPRTILLDGFSKTYAMTGWRLGYGVMPRELAPSIARLQTNSTSCTAAFVQRAGIRALTDPQDSVHRMVEELRRRRDHVVERLNAIPGVRCRLPGGAFYVFPNVSGTGLDGADMARRLLEEAGVACLAGTAFGESATAHLRFSYAASIATIDEGMDRVERFVRSL